MEYFETDNHRHLVCKGCGAVVYWISTALHDSFHESLKKSDYDQAVDDVMRQL
jgi:Fe2+ or Zn2+ uptake regulation protein